MKLGFTSAGTLICRICECGVLKNHKIFMLKPLSIRKKWVCGGLLGGGELLVPFFFHGMLTGQTYREEVLTPFIHALDEDERDFGYFQQYGARVHTAAETMNML